MRASSLVWLLGAAAVAAACGGSGSDGTAPPSNASGGSTTGKAGSSGSTQAGAGQAGQGGTTAGQAGASGGKAGASAGQAGAGQAGKAGAGGGTAGQAGTGQAGAGQAGAGGKAGNAGSSGCQAASDCKATLPPVTPAGCVEHTCNAGVCGLAARDADGDKHRSSKCKALDDTPIVVGDDCDDADPQTYLGAWDGPAGGGQPDRCDGIDQDCDGSPDSGKSASGATCVCAPGDVKSCSEDSSGKVIKWPTGSPTGACKAGAKTCLASGNWGPCTGAVGPATETCNKEDDDCNGIVDDGPAPDNVPFDAIYWAYDGDGDLHARLVGNGYALVHACSFNPPKTAPLACTAGSLAGCKLGATVAECCPPGAWKTAASITGDDCNDLDPATHPLAPELCKDGVDQTCDGKVDEGCVCNPGEEDATCAQLPTGAPITFPGGVPQGACSYGKRVCASDGRSWGQCIGAISPGATDDCAVAGGRDDTCDGTVTCACDPIGSVRDCANQMGKCAGAKQTCGNLGWGPCTIIPSSSDTCEKDNDDNCNGIPNEGCAHVNGDPCGSAATCNLSTWTNCDTSGNCTCAPPIAPLLWCYDGDGDQYCDLSKTQLVCPNSSTQPAAPWIPAGMAVCTAPACNDCNDGSKPVNPGAQDKCDGVDLNCNSIVNEGCNCQNGVNDPTCGKAATCNDGAYQSCTNGQLSACTVPPVVTAGGDCAVGTGMGACAYPGGTVTCSSPTSGVSSCVAKAGIGAGQGFQDHPFAGNGSWDWDCSGQADQEVTYSTNYYEGIDCPTTDAGYEAACNARATSGACNATAYFRCKPQYCFGCSGIGCLGCSWSPFCGETGIVALKCSWNSSMFASDPRCHYKTTTPATPYTMRCK